MRKPNSKISPWRRFHLNSPMTSGKFSSYFWANEENSAESTIPRWVLSLKARRVRAYICDLKCVEVLIKCRGHTQVWNAHAPEQLISQKVNGRVIGGARQNCASCNLLTRQALYMCLGVPSLSLSIYRSLSRVCVCVPFVHIILKFNWVSTVWGWRAAEIASEVPGEAETCSAAAAAAAVVVVSILISLARSASYSLACVQHASESLLTLMRERVSNSLIFPHLAANVLRINSLCTL